MKGGRKAGRMEGWEDERWELEGWHEEWWEEKG